MPRLYTATHHSGIRNGYRLFQGTFAQCVNFAGRMPHVMGPNGPVAYTTIEDAEERRVECWERVLQEEGYLPIYALSMYGEVGRLVKAIPLDSPGVER